MKVTNYEEAKAGLLDGELITGPRACGKTTALVDVIAEKHRGAAILVAKTSENGDYFKKLYSSRHPEVPLPLIFSSRHAICVRGYDEPIYADLFNYFLEGDKDRLRPHLTAAILGD